MCGDDTIIAPARGPANPLNGRVGTFEGSHVDYRCNVDYQWTDGLMTYLQFSTGFKGGGIPPRPCFPERKRTAATIAFSLLVTACSGLERARSPVPPAEVVIDDTLVFPESVTATKAGTLFTGSVKGTIYRAEPGNLRARPWIRSSESNGLLSVLGVLADDRSGTLWVCSVPSPFKGAPPANGRPSALMAFDLETGKQKGVYPFPPPASACNDVTVAADGTVFASDTPNGRIFMLAPRAPTLMLYAQNDQLKGIDGLAFSADGTLYVNIVTRGALLRVNRKPGGAVDGFTELSLSRPIAGPDGFRLIEGNRFLLAEGNGGRIDEVTITEDSAQIRVLKEGLNSPPGVTPLGKAAYAIEGKIGFLIDPKLAGQDPGTFSIRAIPLE